MRDILILAVVLGAFGAAGCHGAAGPQVGYTFDRGASYGWEAGGGWAYAHGNIGQVFRPEAKPSSEESEDFEPDTEWVAYAALEPGYGLGATLGLAVGENDGPGVITGVWGGAPALLIGECEDTCTYISLAGGLRYINGEWELYFTPKFGAVERFSL